MPANIFFKILISFVKHYNAFIVRVACTDLKMFESLLQTKNLLDNVSSLVFQMEKEGNYFISLQRDGSLKTTDVCSRL